MTPQEFTKLVDRFAAEAKLHPLRYKIRVACVAALGYVFVFGAPVIVLALIGAIAASTGVVLVEVLISFAVVAFTVVGSLSLRIERPQGFQLKRSDSPVLFRTVDEIGRFLNCPRVNFIVLSTDFNAGLLQRPRIGFFGFYENYLQLGYPLFLIFSPQQFRALLAHELGHLSGNHGRFHIWVNRMRLSAARLQERFYVRKGLLPALYSQFLPWYRSHLNACSFVLNRSQEYECDRCAAEIAGRQTVAETLARLKGYSELLVIPYWERLWLKAKNQTAPPPDVYAQLLIELARSIPPELLSEFIAHALTQPADVDDSHPSFRERLAALGFNTEKIRSEFATWLAPSEDRAANYFFPKNLEGIASKLAAAWIEKSSAAWMQTYENARRSQQELEALEAKAENQNLSIDEKWNLILRVIENKGDQEAFPLLRSFLEEVPGHVSACRLLGEQLLNIGDESGVAYLEKALSVDPFFAPLGSLRLWNFYASKGDAKNAALWRERHVRFSDTVSNANRERTITSVRDSYRPHGLTPEKLASIQQQLSQVEELKRVFLVRKDVQFLSEVPCYVAAITTRKAWPFRRMREKEKALAAQLSTRLSWPYRTSVFAVGRLWRLRRAIARTQDAAIFRR